MDTHVPPLDWRSASLPSTSPFDASSAPQPVLSGAWELSQQTPATPLIPFAHSTFEAAIDVDDDDDLEPSQSQPPVASTPTAAAEGSSNNAFCYGANSRAQQQRRFGAPIDVNRPRAVEVEDPEEHEILIKTREFHNVESPPRRLGRHCHSLKSATVLLDETDDDDGCSQSQALLSDGHACRSRCLFDSTDGLPTGLQSTMSQLSSVVPQVDWASAAFPCEPTQGGNGEWRAASGLDLISPSATNDQLVAPQSPLLPPRSVLPVAWAAPTQFLTTVIDVPSPQSAFRRQCPAGSLNPEMASAIHIGGRSKQQDTYHIDTLYSDRHLPINFAGVYDGHGGDHVSGFLEMHLHDFIAECPALAQTRSTDRPSAGLPSALVESLRHADCAVYDHCMANHLERHCGSTALAACLQGNVLTVAALGDSQAVLSSGAGHRVAMMSTEHKGTCPAEQARISAFANPNVGVDMNRIGGDLSVSRAVGDYQFKNVETAASGRASPHSALLTDLPVANVADIHSHVLCVDDDFLLMATDGLWDVMTPRQAVDFVHNQLTKGGDGGLSACAPTQLYANLESNVVATAAPCGTTQRHIHNPITQTTSPKSHHSVSQQQCTPQRPSAERAASFCSRTPQLFGTPRKSDFQRAVDALVEHAVGVLRTSDNITVVGMRF